ncbi:MAG: hypothetical protein JWM10_1006, partial [Myxococcaceae bacterium]|nr:hypothetical protein [Myxococcaceae bacterium]
MRRSLVVGLVVGAVGCGFPTEEFRLGTAAKDTGVDAPRADTGAVDAPAVDVIDVAPADVVVGRDAPGDV